LRELAVPRTFIIDRQSRLAWFGHPIDADQPLAAIVDGSWRIDSARDAANRRERDRLASRGAANDYIAAADAKDDAAALTAAERACAVPLAHVDGLSPPWWAWTARVQLLVASGESEEAVAVALKGAELKGIRDEAVPLAQLARLIAILSPSDAAALTDRALTEIRNVESDPRDDSWTAYMRDASLLPNSVALLDVAAADFAIGTPYRRGRAVVLQREALARWPDDPRLVPRRSELAANLAVYEEAAGRSSP